MMSLVPILYTSLILFAILMFVIVSASYIAYKFRNRNSYAEKEVRTTTSYLKPAPVPRQQRVYHPQAIRVVPAIKTPELRRTDLQPEAMNRSTVVNVNDYLRESKSVNITRNPEPSPRTKEYSRRTNAGSFKSRLEIINKIIPKESTKEKFTVSGSGSIALPKYYENFKAIQYYSDEDDEYLYKPSRHYS